MSPYRSSASITPARRGQRLMRRVIVGIYVANAVSLALVSGLAVADRRPLWWLAAGAYALCATSHTLGAVMWNRWPLAVARWWSR